jgi:hypothetical protein
MKDGGKGLDGVAAKEGVYFNPFVDMMMCRGNTETLVMPKCKGSETWK